MNKGASFKGASDIEIEDLEAQSMSKKGTRKFKNYSDNESN